jgi:MerR family transcriptional regulator/heat shock protein HspR
MTPRRRSTDTGGDRPLYMISVAADLAGMHPQTLRIYERRALVSPQRSAGNTRLYSDADIERLRLIQHLTQDEGVNLAGVVRIMELENDRQRMLGEMETLREQLEEVHEEMRRELTALRASQRADIVLVRRGNLRVRPQDG